MNERDKNGIGSEAGAVARYESELTSLLVIALVSAAARFWYILMVMGTIGVLSGIAILVSQLFVRGMSNDIGRIERLAPSYVNHATVPLETGIRQSANDRL